jgi:hypothetical protein
MMGGGVKLFVGKPDHEEATFHFTMLRNHLVIEMNGNPFT